MINRELIKKLKEENDRDMNKEKGSEKFIFVIDLKDAKPYQITSFYSEMTLVDLESKFVAMMTCAMVWFKVFYYSGTAENKSDLWVTPSSIRTIRYSKVKDRKRDLR